MYCYNALVTRVVDGDTLDLLVDLGFYTQMKIRVRLLGVDTPEIYGVDKAAGVTAKQYVESLVLGRQVVVWTQKGDSFGRWLATIQVGDLDLTQHLIDTGYGTVI
jgi:micrococcal nuclease